MCARGSQRCSRWRRSTVMASATMGEDDEACGDSGAPPLQSSCKADESEALGAAGHVMGDEGVAVGA